VRWWNVKHPTAYADRLAAGASPALARETLTADQRLSERVLLGVRLAEGFPISELPEPALVAGLIADELVDGPGALAGRIVLTLRGRLLADTVIRALLP
jgi:oxygen-independent coproporphyrinogen-3 oxidase